MVAFQVETVKDILSLNESLTIAGVLLLVIAGLIYQNFQLKKEHKEEKKILRAEVKDIQARFEAEYKETNKEMKVIAQQYHVFTTRIFDKLNTLLSKD